MLFKSDDGQCPLDTLIKCTLFKGHPVGCAKNSKVKKNIILVFLKYYFSIVYKCVINFRTTKFVVQILNLCYKSELKMIKK